MPEAVDEVTNVYKKRFASMRAQMSHAINNGMIVSIIDLSLMDITYILLYNWCQHIYVYHYYYYRCDPNVVIAKTP